jgi:hypothetical protein
MKSITIFHGKMLYTLPDITLLNIKQVMKNYIKEEPSLTRHKSPN